MAALTGIKKDPADDGPTAEDKLQDLDRRIEQARADNDIDEVVKLNAEHRAIEKAEFAIVAADTAEKTGTQQQNKMNFDDVVANLEKTQDVLNPDHKDFDEDLINDILDLQRGWVHSGKYTAAEAMQKAAAHFLPEATPPVDIGDKKKTDIEKNLEVAGQMPPDSKDKGADSDKGGDVIKDAAQINEMSTKEFDALPETTKSRLRGDTYAG